MMRPHRIIQLLPVAMTLYLVSPHPTFAAGQAWYLLVPPSAGEGCGPPLNCDYLRAWPADLVPVRRWRVDKAFDSASSCEKERGRKLMFWADLAREEHARAGTLKPEDFRIGMMRHYGAARCLPSEAISSSPRWYLGVPPYPLTDQASVREWRMEEGYYFAADCERVAQNHRQIAQNTLKALPGIFDNLRQEKQKLERQKEEALDEKEQRIIQVQLELLGLQFEQADRFRQGDAQGRYARCWSSEALPAGMLPLKK